MRVRLRSSLLGVALLAGALAPIATAGVACAASSAALVVSTGSNNYTYCVELGGSSVNGIQLIQRAGSQHGLQYKLGYGGNAVCMLANVGASGNDCFGEHPHFWGYWRDNSSGGWSWSGTGASNVTVGAGDMSGWSWGTGDGGSSHPPPPATTYESVCGVTPAPDPRPEPGKPKGGRSDGAKPRVGAGESSDGGGGDGAATSSTPGDEDRTVADNSKTGGGAKGKKPDGDAKGQRKDEAEDYELAVPVASPSATPGAVSNPAGATARDPDAPVAAVVALGLTAALAALGAVLVRRRRRLEEG